MFKKLKSLLIGRTLQSTEAEHEKFNVLWGLPILSSDAISSVSYACEEILMVLVPVVALGAYKPLLLIAAAIIVLLFILVFSYRQTIDNYPNGGGSYSVATDNLGHVPGLIAASSLSIDYILTVAVSVSSGVAAIVSAFPELLPYKVWIALAIVALLTLGNLRGIRESSVLFGVPTYMFMLTVLAMIFVGLIKVLVRGTVPVEPSVRAAAAASSLGDMSIVLLLKAFSSGCTALTGVEAVSNGIPNFRHPAQKHAKQVLTLLALIVLVIFGGVCTLASVYKIAPQHDVTVMAQIAIQVFGAHSVMFYAVQVTTAIILIMAANTAFADLPLLLSLLGRDGYMARQFTSRGARLSFSNGIILLFLVASVLIVVFHAETHQLIPLYAVGVFLSFTLSQAGMFKRWITRREGNWHHKAVINGIGTAVTAVTCVIIAVSKFTHGAWMVIVCIPLLVLLMLRIKRHYIHVRANLYIEGEGRDAIFREQPAGHIVVPVQSVNKSFIKALNYAMYLNGEKEVYHVSVDPAATEKVRRHYEELGTDIPLVVENAPYRNVNEVLYEHIRRKHGELGKHEMLTVVMPQFIIPKWWNNPLHNQTARLLKGKLMKFRNIALVTIPYIINE